MNTTNAVVVIPWRPEPSRIAAHDRVLAWWLDHGYTVVHVDSDPHADFNLSQARNNGVRVVEEAGCGVVIVADADTIPQQDVIREAIRRAREGAVVVYPFSHYRYVTESPLSEKPFLDMEFEKEMRRSVGGMIVVTPETYWLVGGFDERFRQWGYEDTAFRIAAETLASVARITGTVFAFAHPAERIMGEENPGHFRSHLYRMCRGEPDLMRELIK